MVTFSFTILPFSFCRLSNSVLFLPAIVSLVVFTNTGHSFLFLLMLFCFIHHWVVLVDKIHFLFCSFMLHVQLCCLILVNFSCSYYFCLYLIFVTFIIFPYLIFKVSSFSNDLLSFFFYYYISSLWSIVCLFIRFGCNVGVLGSHLFFHSFW